MEKRPSLGTPGARDMAPTRGFYDQLGWRASSANTDAVTVFQAGGG